MRGSVDPTFDQAMKKSRNDMKGSLTQVVVISPKAEPPQKQKISGSYKTFEMVSKLLQNGSTTKSFFERYQEGVVVQSPTKKRDVSMKDETTRIKTRKIKRRCQFKKVRNPETEEKITKFFSHSPQPQMKCPHVENIKNAVSKAK